MRLLGATPKTFRDAGTNAPSFGSFAGPLPKVDLAAPTLFTRVAKRKRWMYVAATTDDVWVAFAVVRTGYATNVFVFVYDLAARRMLADRIALGPATALVGDDPNADGVLASFAFAGSHVRIHRRGSTVDVTLRIRDVDVELALDETGSPPSIAAIAQLGPGLASGTEKRALASTRGSVRVAGRRLSLDGGVAGWDYTHGLLPRHTRWRWAFAMGKTDADQPIAFNLTEGFVGEAECALFHRGELRPLAEPRIVLDREHPLSPWKLTGQGIDLSFTPGAMHADATNLVVVRSRFVQPVGTFHGTLRIPSVDGRVGGEEELRLDGVPGVVEDQDVLW